METRIDHKQLINLLDGFYKCRQCNRISPYASSVRHIQACDWKEVEDISLFDIESQKYFDLLEIEDYYKGKTEDSTLLHRKKYNVNVNATFPSLMLSRLVNRISEQKFIIKRIDNELNSTFFIESEEIRTIKDVIPLKRLECLEVVY